MWFGSSPAVELVPSDRVRPIHFFENSPLVQGNNMAVSIVFDGVLDPEKLHRSLEGLVKRKGWERLGGRLRKNASGNIEWHIPTEFTAERPAITFSHVDHNMPASSHPAASKIPRPSDRPSVVSDPDDLEELAWGPGYTPGGISDYLTADRPVLGLRVNSFTDRTIATLQWQHVAFDALGMQYVVEGWNEMLWGDDDDIAEPCEMETDPFDALAKGARPTTEEHVLSNTRVGLGGMLKWGLGYGVDMLLRAKENRMVCVPQSYWQAQLDKALNELREEAAENGEDVSKVFLTENDVLTAWIMRCVITPLDMNPDRPVNISIAMSLRKAFENDLIPPSSERPYVGNAFGWANILLQAKDITTKPLSYVARQVRKAINEQGTRAQHEAYFALVRQHGMGLPIVIFGDGNMAQVGLSNWSKAGLFDLDFSPALKSGDGPCRPVYVQENHGPIKPVDGFFILGKDEKGNYWTSACKLKGQWEKFQEQLDKDFEQEDDSRTAPDTSDTSANQSTLQTGEILARSLHGVSVRDGEGSGLIFVVTWQGDDDKLNPRNWSVAKRIAVTFEVSLISAAVVIASSIDATALPQAAEEFGVSHVVESLAIGLYLVGIGVGSLFAGPFSETFGRNAVYIGSLIIFMVWFLGAALSPKIGAQLVFRSLAGCCGSTPIVCCGGSVADMWNSLDKTWGFPIYTSVGFGGSVLGAVIGAYIAPSGVLDWRWVEWIVLVLAGALWVLVLLTMPETYGPLLLHWRASQYRRVTGDHRFHSEEELVGATFASRLRISMTRPFLMLTEPIIIVKTIYLSVLYIILFTFLVGWPYIFEYTYHISQDLTNVIFISMFIGMQCVGLLIPIVYRKTARACRQAESLDKNVDDQVKFSPELRLWYAMLGPAVATPVSLFWLGWTANSSIDIWSAILAAFLFGFGITGVFISTYLYIIDSYEVYSASALTFVSLVRYIAAGGMTVVGIPWYENMGVSHTLTILACISVLLVPIPYLLYFYGHHLRAKSKYAVSWE